MSLRRFAVFAIVNHVSLTMQYHDVSLLHHFYLLPELLLRTEVGDERAYA